MQLGFSPDYVLDEMQWYEINAALKYRYYSFKDSWEQARLISYMIAQTNTRKKLTFNDITKFFWDEDNKEDIEDTKISKEDIERLNKKATAYLTKIQENGKH